MSTIPNRLYRGEGSLNEELHNDGRTLFFTDNEEEALGYGPHLIEVTLHVSRMFSPADLLYRVDGAWKQEGGSAQSIDTSARFLQFLQNEYGNHRAEDIYYNVEGGSWSEVERPEIQRWLRESGYEGFICWEGEGTTYAVFDPTKVEVIGRTLVHTPSQLG